MINDRGVNFHADQSPSSIFRPLAASVRTLRNKLEEADEALNETSTRPENIGVLQAAAESQSILRRLEQTTHQQPIVPANSETCPRDNLADFMNDIDEVTDRLSLALEALERLNGNIGPAQDTETSDSSHIARTSSTMTSQSDEGTKTTTPSSSLSFRSKPARLSQRLSINSEHTGVWKQETEQQALLSPKVAQSPQSALRGESRPRSLETTVDGWTMSPTYFDPMSLDIDSASSLIMGHEVESGEATSPSLASFSQIGEPTKPPTRVTDGRLSHSFSRRNPPTGLRIFRSDSTTISAHRTALSQEDQTPGGSVSPEYHAVSSDDAISRDEPRLPDALQKRFHALYRPQQVATSKYRVINPDLTSISPTSVEPATNWHEDSRYASWLAAQQQRELLLQTSASPKYESLASPTSSGIDAHPEHEFLGYDETDNETIQLIVRLWNSSLWDQAKLHIIRLASRHKRSHGTKAARRIQHLLGVIHSLQGELHQALKHFAAVFDYPIADARQLDIGHCAAAYWMGDIYSLLNRKGEALLAYSIAAKSPLLQDSRWLPLRECLVAELELCRRGVGSVDWGKEKQARASGGSDSILDPDILPQEVAKTILEPIIQPSRQDSKAPSIEIPEQSRASFLHSIGLRPDSNKDIHSLQIDATAFTPSTPWPLLFDPFFAFQPVLQHRLLITPTDLLRSNGAFKASSLPKKTRLAFTCQDLSWLILALRKCLTKLDMQWSEVLDGQSPRFIARYSRAGEGGIVNVCYFSIPIYRLSFRPGYGVDICSDGVCSARVLGGEGEKNGLCKEEAKRVKKLVKELLESAARRYEALEARNVALPVVSINGVTSLRGK
ncbi:hypothetical protein Q7P37_011292 [Cladosporium fusiforme]